MSWYFKLSFKNYFLIFIFPATCWWEAWPELPWKSSWFGALSHITGVINKLVIAQMNSVSLAFFMFLVRRRANLKTSIFHACLAHYTIVSVSLYPLYGRMERRIPVGSHREMMSINPLNIGVWSAIWMSRLLGVLWRASFFLSSEVEIQAEFELLAIAILCSYNSHSCCLKMYEETWCSNFVKL